MSNSIQLNAEFGSFQEFKAAFDAYCNHNAINGVPLQFKCQRSTKLNPNSFNGEVLDAATLLTFVYRKYTYVCEHHKSRSTNKNLDDSAYCEGRVGIQYDQIRNVLCVSKFVGTHTNHPVQENSVQRKKNNSNQPSNSTIDPIDKMLNNKSKVLLNDIGEASRALEPAQKLANIQVLCRLLQYIRSGAGYTVNFVGSPTDGDKTSPVAQRVTSIIDRNAHNDPPIAVFTMDSDDLVDLTSDDEGSANNIDSGCHVEQAGPSTTLVQTTTESSNLYHEVLQMPKPQDGDESSSDDEEEIECDRIVNIGPKPKESMSQKNDDENIIMTNPNGKDDRNRNAIEMDKEIGTPKTSLGKRAGGSSPAFAHSSKVPREVFDEKPEKGADDENTSPNITSTMLTRQYFYEKSTDI